MVKGTKKEWLQKIWSENYRLRAEIEWLKAKLSIDTVLANSLCGENEPTRRNIVKNRKLVRSVAFLLCNNECTRRDFMYDVNVEMQKHGFIMTCNQKGVHGTEVLISVLGKPE
jgi:hypothetical protein